MIKIFLSRSVCRVPLVMALKWDLPVLTRRSMQQEQFIRVLSRGVLEIVSHRQQLMAGVALSSTRMPEEWIDPGLGGFLSSIGNPTATENMGKHKVPTLRNVHVKRLA